MKFTRAEVGIPADRNGRHANANNGNGTTGGDADGGAGGGDDLSTASEGQAVKGAPLEVVELGDLKKPDSGFAYVDRHAPSQITAPQQAPHERLIDTLTEGPLVPSQLDPTGADETPMSRMEGESIKAALMILAGGIDEDRAAVIRSILYPDGLAEPGPVPAAPFGQATVIIGG